jgi:probable rRNA maturation factor
MPGYRVGIEFEADPGDLDSGAIEALVERVLVAESVPVESAVGILFTTDEGIRHYNREFRQIDAPTDVLSFELNVDDDFAKDDADELGDIVISLEAARRQAVEHEWSLQEEVAHLAVHATLHLCGHDHEESAVAEVAMRAREEEFLGPLGNVHS